MNNSGLQNKKQKKATVLYRSFFVVLFLCGISFSYSQESEVRHYQRNCTLDSVVLPGEVYNSEIYLINFPDSLYTGGVISIKKLKVNGIKTKTVFRFNNNRYTVMNYTFAKRHKDKIMELIDEKSKTYSVDLKKHRGKYTLTLTLKTEEENL